ncbi:MAG: cation-translocating P-type ATPase [Oscillospiraceae bacterium]|nr:cation-translocating P-type ATPase [Oscillospiraceae bacterium]
MQGLTNPEAQKRQQQYGLNTLAEPQKPHPFRIFFGQFRDVMVLILLAAALISFLLHEYADAVTIAVIVVLNAILGFVQEFRTEQTILALRSMTAPTAKVMRGGKQTVIPAEQLVPGDCILLEAGDRVPADAVIRQCAQLFAEESILTGESLPVEKRPYRGAALPPDNAARQEYYLYAGTAVTRGTAEAEVTHIGKSTQMGQISQLLTDIEDAQTPLQKRLAELGRVVAVICLAVCVLVSLAGILRGEPVFDMLMTGITIAIAAIPEGLPATVTIALALAVRRMLAKHALVNRLHAVETLGCASVICSDKTGTITENKMTVQALCTADADFALSGTGWQKSGTLSQNGVPCSPRSNPDLMPLLRCAVLCNHAALSEGSGGEWDVTGDPTEAALLVAAAKCRTGADSFSRFRIISEIPFDSDTRSMTVFCQSENGILACAKGAIDVMLQRCAYYREGGRILPMTPQKRAELSCKADALASEALRVLAFAEQEHVTAFTQPNAMVFLGMSGMLDPPREQAKRAIADCTRAGIRVVMLTGDHIKTAAAIARRAGIPHAGNAMTGEELDRLSDSELDACLDRYAVFARVTPAHKLRLVRAFRRKGHISAMTGDGVNDAPAVKEADIGVAMGKNGTDVTRQAADIILLDDRFDTMVASVEQGRTVYANIRKFVRYLLACNIGEVLTMFAGILMGMPMVLLPTQILLVNLMTDGLPAVALGLEPPAPNVMQQPPRRATDSFFAGGLLSRIIFRGIFIAVSTLFSFTTVLRLTGSLPAARTGALVTLICSQLLHVFECKREDGTLFSVPYFSNGKLILAVLSSAAVTFAALRVPVLQRVFSTVMLPPAAMLTALGFSLAVPLAAALTARIGSPRSETVRHLTSREPE